jgi:DNA-binding PadR family transcriptional regulator
MELMLRPSRDPRPLLPLPPHDLYILLALLDQAMHGYGIIQDVARRTDGETALGTSTVYAALKRLLAAGVIVETGRPAGERSGDKRRRYYRATPFGHTVAREAASDLARLHGLVREAKLLGRAAPASGRSRP